MVEEDARGGLGANYVPISPPISHLPSPISHLSLPISHLPSPISHLSPLIRGAVSIPSPGNLFPISIKSCVVGASSEETEHDSGTEETEGDERPLPFRTSTPGRGAVPPLSQPSTLAPSRGQSPLVRFPEHSRTTSIPPHPPYPPHP
ncbi:hypothetical protein Vafri_2476, partial [Volvox africanus]